MMKMIECRICGNPTKYWAKILEGRVHCGVEACRKESRDQKNAKIAATHRSDYASGKRRKLRDGWKGISRVSAEEQVLLPWFTERGWVAQFKLLTNVSSVKLPRAFWLDFALPERKLCVEIDGSSHNTRLDRDKRKNRMLRERGWRILRVPASLVRDDLQKSVLKIDRWISGHNTCEIIP